MRSNVAGSRYLSAIPSASARVLESTVEKTTRPLPPGASRRRRLRLKIGSRTAPVVFERGRPSIIDIGVRMPRPRPRKRPRSVSYCEPPVLVPSTETTWAAQTRCSSDVRVRRVARSVSSSATASVCTKILENAGWAASSRGGASTISAYDVTSISRASLPRFVSVTRRISALSSGETSTSSRVSRLPSRRWISARSSRNVTS